MLRGYPDQRATSFCIPNSALDGRAGSAGTTSLVGVASERLRVTKVSRAEPSGNARATNLKEDGCPSGSRKARRKRKARKARRSPAAVWAAAPKVRSPAATRAAAPKAER